MEKIFLLFWMMVNIATTHSLKCCVFAEQELLQGDIINNNFDISLISGMHILKEVCYMMTSFPAIHFFYDRVIISREHLKWSICQGHCVYFTALAAVIHYNKRSVVDSRKFEGYVYLMKTIVALWISWYFFKKKQKMDSMGIPFQIL